MILMSQLSGPSRSGSALAVTLFLGALEVFSFSGCLSRRGGESEGPSGPDKDDQKPKVVQKDGASKDGVSSTPSALPQYKPLACYAEPTKIPFPGRESYADIYQYPGGVKVPVLHVNSEGMAPPDIEGLFDILTSDPDRRGMVVHDPTNPWADTEKQYDFNCHAFALGETIGLTPNDQFNGSPIRTLGYPNPVKPILEKFFTLKKTYPREGYTAADFLYDTELKKNDRVFLVTGEGDDMVHHHSGRVRHVQRENWIIHKFGMRPLLLTPPKPALERFDYDRIEIWVPKQEASKVDSTPKPAREYGPALKEQ